MSNIVCAYCHIKGHHIKNCEELAEKNRRKPTKQQSSFVRPSNPVPLRSVAAAQQASKPVVIAAKNTFADLYSSEDDEVEDGEIVEEDRLERIQAAQQSYVFRPISPESSDANSETKWRRSGVKGVVIPIQTATKNDTSDDENSECGSYELSPEMQKRIEEFMVYSRKYAGMSWVDIECTSDDE
jgi:hypothetical protein